MNLIRLIVYIVSFPLARVVIFPTRVVKVPMHICIESVKAGMSPAIFYNNTGHETRGPGHRDEILHSADDKRLGGGLKGS